MTPEEIKARPYLIQNGTITKEQIERLKGIKLMIGTPMYGGQCCSTYHFACCELMKLLTRLNIPVQNNILFNESLVQRGRNNIANTFLESDYTHLLFIDADIGFNPPDIISMLLCDKGVVGAAYAKKSIHWDRALKAHEMGVPDASLGHCSGDFVFRPKANCEVRVFDLLDSKYLGTGFMLIQKQVLEKLKDVKPPLVKSYQPNSGKPNEKGKTYYAFFDCDVVNNEYLSEDYWFCEQVMKMGEQLWLAPWVYVTHMGTMEFKGCFFCSQGKLIHNIGQPAVSAPTPESGLSPIELLNKMQGKK